MSSRKSWGLATARIALLVSLDTPSLSQKFCQVLAVLTVNPIDECFSGCRQVQLVALAEPTAEAAHRQPSRLLALEMQAPDAPTAPLVTISYREGRKITPDWLVESS